MADHQKIHPVATDVEAAPQPLVPQASLQKGDPEQRQVPLVPPPLQPRKVSCCCHGCLCWTLGLLTLLLVVFGATAGIIYLVFQPKLPKYSVDNLRVSDLTLNFDLSLSLPRINPQILPGASEQDGIGCRLNREKSIWENSAGCTARAATEWRDSA